MTTPNLQLPEWVADQNQPNVNINTALRVLDALAQLRILTWGNTVPPSDPQDGECHIPGASATGDWATHDNDVAIYVSNAWVFRTPLGGWEGWSVSDGTRIRYDDTASPAGWILI